MVDWFANLPILIYFINEVCYMFYRSLRLLSDSRFYVSSYYIGLFIRLWMGRLSSRLQVMELSETRKLSEDEQEAGVPVLLLSSISVSAV